MPTLTPGAALRTTPRASSTTGPRGGRRAARLLERAISSVCVFVGKTDVVRGRELMMGKSWTLLASGYQAEEAHCFVQICYNGKQVRKIHAPEE